MIYVGIDTGVNTGFAVWDSKQRSLLQVCSLPIHKAMERVRSLYDEYKAGIGDKVIVLSLIHIQMCIRDRRNGLFDLKPLYEWMRNALDGIYRIEVKKVRKPRSLDQNGWLFGCIYPILLDALLEAGWEFVSVEQVHEFFKAQMTADKVVNKHTGEIIEFPCSTSTMDTVTFSTYCEKLREYAKEFLNVDIPDPDKYWRSHEKNT